MSSQSASLHATRAIQYNIKTYNANNVDLLWSMRRESSLSSASNCDAQDACQTCHIYTCRMNNYRVRRLPQSAKTFVHLPFSLSATEFQQHEDQHI